MPAKRKSQCEAILEFEDEEEDDDKDDLVTALLRH